MIDVNTNISSLYVTNQSRLNLLEYNEKVERLTNGIRVNRGADDPSGLAISAGMQAQLRGIGTAIGNAQETIHMLHLGDSLLSNLWDMLAQMRNLCVRLANTATLSRNPSALPTDPPTTDDSTILQKEIELLKDHVFMSITDQLGPQKFVPPFGSSTAPRYNYMTKPLFAPGFTSPNLTTGLDAQIGPDNNTSNRIGIVTDDLMTYLSDFATPYNPPPPAGNATSNWFEGYAQQMLDNVDDKMSKVMKIRVDLGTQMNRIDHTINDLSAEYINVANSKSKITDADMAEEVTAMTKNMIRQQSTTVVASQANAQPLITINLLEAVYNGLNPTTVWNSHVGPTPEEGITL